MCVKSRARFHGHLLSWASLEEEHLNETPTPKFLQFFSVRRFCSKERSIEAEKLAKREQKGGTFLLFRVFVSKVVHIHPWLPLPRFARQVSLSVMLLWQKRERMPFPSHSWPERFELLCSLPVVSSSFERKLWGILLRETRWKETHSWTSRPFHATQNLCQNSLSLRAFSSQDVSSFHVLSKFVSQANPWKKVSRKEKLRPLRLHSLPFHLEWQAILLLQDCKRENTGQEGFLEAYYPWRSREFVLLLSKEGLSSHLLLKRVLKRESSICKTCCTQEKMWFCRFFLKLYP